MYDQSIDQEQTPQANKGCGKAAVIGCSTLLALVIIIGILAFFGIKQAISKLADQYTDTEPRTLPTLVISDVEAEEVVSRMDQFTKAIGEEVPTEALSLTARDINVLIHRHPDWTNMTGRVHVEIKAGKVHGETSIPLSKMGKMFEGRYLNGSGEFSVGLTAGRLAIFAESLEVRGKPLPPEFMKGFRGENLANNANQDPEVAIVLDRLQAINVKDGELNIVPVLVP